MESEYGEEEDGNQDNYSYQEPVHEVCTEDENESDEDDAQEGDREEPGQGGTGLANNDGNFDYPSDDEGQEDG